MFRIVSQPISADACRAQLGSPSAGGFVSFEGWVRNHNEGRVVRSLEYEAYEALANKEGERILAEAKTKFAVEQVFAAHRVGHLSIGEIAVWVGAAAAHRDAAFAACRYVIDEIKTRLPIWKREHYAEGPAEWVNCAHNHAPHL